jgi:hypothetical protein
MEAKFCKVCGKKISYYYARRGEDYCSVACKNLDKKKTSEEPKVVIDIPEVGTFYITPVDNKIAFLLGSGHSIEDTARLVKRSKKYIENLLNSEDIEFREKFRKLINYYTNKDFADFTSEVKREMMKRLREITKKETQKDPLEWLRTYVWLLQTSSPFSKMEFNKEVAMEIERLSKKLEDGEND